MILRELSLPVSIIREGKSYIAYTPALDLSTCGKDYEEAKKRFSEAVDIFFKELAKKGTTENVLKSLGWKKVQSRWNPPIIISQESQNVRVPVK